MAIDMSREAVSQRLNAMGELWQLSVHLMQAKPEKSISHRPIRSRALDIQDSIRQILSCDWDPIGVSDAPMAADEYDAYISPVYRILVGTRSEDDLISCLRRIEREEMGIPSSEPEGLRIVAEKLLSLNIKLN